MDNIKGRTGGRGWEEGRMRRIKQREEKKKRRFWEEEEEDWEERGKQIGIREIRDLGGWERKYREMRKWSGDQKEQEGEEEKYWEEVGVNIFVKVLGGKGQALSRRIRIGRGG